ncbi:Forkhead-associated domain protein [Candidatus Magnetomorum sp. HK-1]|nr:Forkhead-associated domain protein [Candidatus Magnetomorum sp. HK-1]
MKKFCIEIIDGPMDGLTCICKKKNLISSGGAHDQLEDIDNVMHLPFDKGISRYHAEIVQKEENWYFCDFSKNGTSLFEFGPLKSNEKYLLKHNQFLLIGKSTILKIYETNNMNNEVTIRNELVIKEEYFSDIRDNFNECMTDQLKQMWDDIYLENNIAKYCDTKILFDHLIRNSIFKDSFQKNCLPSRIHEIRCQRIFKLDKFLIAPRVWRIMNMAKRISTNNSIDINDLIFSIFLENRSLLAEAMKQNSSFITNFIIPYSYKHISTFQNQFLELSNVIKIQNTKKNKQLLSEVDAIQKEKNIIQREKDILFKTLQLLMDKSFILFEIDTELHDKYESLTPIRKLECFNELFESYIEIYSNTHKSTLKNYQALISKMLDEDFKSEIEKFFKDEDYIKRIIDFLKKEIARIFNDQGRYKRNINKNFNESKKSKEIIDKYVN